jgi:hypothetical protein
MFNLNEWSIYLIKKVLRITRQAARTGRAIVTETGRHNRLVVTGVHLVTLDYYYNQLRQATPDVPRTPPSRKVVGRTAPSREGGRKPRGHVPEAEQTPRQAYLHKRQLLSSRSYAFKQARPAVPC